MGQLGEAIRCVNTERPLTHPLDLGERQAAVKATRVCEVADCEGIVHVKALCKRHYKRHLEGRPLEGPFIPQTRRAVCAELGCDQTSSRWRGGDMCTAHGKRRQLENSVFSRIEVTGCCWLWQGHVLQQGYGEAGWSGMDRRAHRAVYELLVEPIPSGMTLDHLCRVLLCVNPDHLQVVSRSENTTRGNMHVQHTTRLFAAPANPLRVAS